MKRLISIVLAGSLILGCTGVAFAAGTSTNTASTVSTTNIASTTAAAISLSLKQAITQMQTVGSEAETAAINKESDDALAKGYSETARTIDEALDGINTICKLESWGLTPAVIQSKTGYSSSLEASSVAQNAGATGLNETITKMRRDFAKEQIDNNYKAEMNGIEYETVDMYYNVLLASENFRIAQDNVKTKKDILKDTQAMLAIGMVAKKEVLAVKADLGTAESAAQAAGTTLKTAKMGFNYLLGYPILQEVKLTDQLTEIAAPTITVESAIASALKNRNEIKGANFAETVYGTLLKNMALTYPLNSSTYLKEQVTYRNAKKTASDALIKIEIDIRSQYSGLEDKKSALEKAEQTLDYADEGYRLTKLSYSVGMSTLSDLQAMQVTRYTAALGKAAAIRDYDLAVYNFNYAASIGTSRLPL